jgi:hypothetical protein
MLLLRTLVLTPTFEVVREAVTFTTAAEFDNTGLFQVFNRAQRPIYKFEVRCEPLLRLQAEELAAFHAFHQGGKSFLWNGGPYGRTENYNLFGEGNGARRQFFLPNRYVGAGSLALQSRNQVTAATSNWATSSSNSWPWSLNPTPGVVTTANSTNTIVLSGHDLYAQYGCQYRVLFEPGGIEFSEYARNVFKAQFKLIETLFTF